MWSRPTFIARREQRRPRQRAVGVVEREHRRGLADGDVVEHPERGDDQPGEHEPLQVEPLDREPGEDRVVRGEPGDRPVDEQQPEPIVSTERPGGPDDRRGGHLVDAVGEVEGDDHDRDRPDQRDQRRALPREDRRHDEPDDDQQRQGRARAATAGRATVRSSSTATTNSPSSTQQGRQALEVGDEVGDLAVGR
jgi:hypothetical protein